MGQISMEIFGRTGSALSGNQHETALKALQEELVGRRAEIQAEVDAVGSELAQMLALRDAARAELERFAALKGSIGLELVPYRKKTVIVVPEGSEIKAWGAPGLSDLARYNGRMYRVVEKR